MSTQLDRLRALVKNLKSEVESDLQGIKKRTQVISITSGKGGVGKTNFTINFGLALVEMGKKVIILDADLGLANIDVVLGITPSYNLYHVLNEEKELAEIIIEGPEGIKIIPGGSGVFELAELKEWQLERFLLKLTSLEGEYDYLLIDTGAGLSRSVLNFSLAADEVLVITTPEPTALTDAYGLIKTLVMQKYQGKLKLIVNRALSPEEGRLTANKLKLVVDKFLKDCNLESMGWILDDKVVSQAVKKQEPFLLSFPYSKASTNIYSMAAEFTKQNFRLPQAVGLKNYFHKILTAFRS